MKRIFFPVLLISALLAASSARAQVPVYYGPLMYAFPFDTSAPPINISMPSGIITDYLYFDEAMRLNSTGQVLSYIKGMTWNDTAQWIAGNLYQIHDYDPLVFNNWCGYCIKAGDPYKCEPGDAQAAFENMIKNVVGSHTYALFFSDIISDVMVSDTVCTKDPTANIATDMVLVNASILDEIKGQNIPSCTPYSTAHKKGAMPLSVATPASPIWTYSTPADSGGCIKFAYSPEWPSVFGDDAGMTHLTDLTGGWWVKPGTEYIVFLSFTGIGLDSTSGYFTIFPGGFGTCGGMYPVIGGYVYDPHDDFGFGSTHLTVAEWKARLRARINKIVKLS